LRLAQAHEMERADFEVSGVVKGAEDFALGNDIFRAIKKIVHAAPLQAGQLKQTPKYMKIEDTHLGEDCKGDFSFFLPQRFVLPGGGGSIGSDERGDEGKRGEGGDDGPTVKVVVQETAGDGDGEWRERCGPVAVVQDEAASVLRMPTRPAQQQGAVRATHPSPRHSALAAGSAVVAEVMTLQSWLCSLGLEHMHQTLVDEDVGTLADVRLCTKDDLKELGFKMGARNKLLAAIAALPRED
jgi:hypothetical protein